MYARKHLPLIGVGPIIVIPQLILTIVGIIMTANGAIFNYSIEFLNIPFILLGVFLIVYGFMLWYGANFKTNIDKCIRNNQLATTGVYSLVRNPIYSAFFIFNIGVICIKNNLVLFIISVISWIYMTIILINTEEKWLYNLYGREYKLYCKKVNRCIPIKRNVI